MKQIIAGILVAVVIVVGAVSLLGRGAAAPQNVAAVGGNVAVTGGTQIVTISVRGGYRPLTSTVKAGVPTTLRFETNGTFDCSSSVRIPSLGISRLLPTTGVTDIDVGTMQPGTLQGTCGMGMYRFDVVAQ